MCEKTREIVMNASLKQTVSTLSNNSSKHRFYVVRLVTFTIGFAEVMYLTSLTQFTHISMKITGA